MLDQLFEEAIYIINKLEKYNYQAYFVGGCVRDYLLKRPISDIDIATSAPPEKVQLIFSNVIPIGLKHGTVIVRHLHKSYEVTTFRIDGKYSDNRRPDNVEFIQSIDEDLKRRDFTINALAMDSSGNIIDLFDGTLDLRKKVIRTVGKGSERFHEDPLRIIRALRFSSQLGFAIDTDTLKDMMVIGPEITKLAVERIRVEVTKFFGGSYIDNGINYLKKTEVHLYLPVMINYPYIIDKLPTRFDPLNGFSEIVTFFHYLEPSICMEEWFVSWKCSNQEKRDVKQLVKSIDYYKKYGLDKWLVYCLRAPYFDAFVRLLNLLYPSELLTKKEIILIHDSLVIHTREELEVDGHDLIALFPNKGKGPWIQEALNKIEKDVILNHVPNKNNELKDWIKWNPPEIS
ncbi:CCA tRNA nucleotidyltransferase [Virgibacillus necropolis]|uniref:CCA-adding enzyme n=1 Tax=Virgibacillus necropolis TaxID=163877 RepID=A0A221MCX1_9BACI|nr:CCA tRNA nucleotidyltransferase [Virgibacillus necropolis]ASN05526.1 CCA tRNA nucleotidyltransferase [Virgibacillus necropolis]